MIIGIQAELLKISSLGLLPQLLVDKTTKGNILWSTDAYEPLGPEYQRNREIKPHLIIGENSSVIKNRARKALEQQTERVKSHAEVFTPLAVCRKMNDVLDEQWFHRKNVFGSDGAPPEKILFSPQKKWQRYVDSRRLEITCGEAPFLVSRYDVETGEVIPLENRIGILDRKLRVVCENTADEAEWLKWTARAFQSVYGYEFQGDNLLIARLNLLMSFEEYVEKYLNRKPTLREYKKIANIIAWNLWQMDGLTETVPYSRAEEPGRQLTLDDLLGNIVTAPLPMTEQPCRIFNWRAKRSFIFSELRVSDSELKFERDRGKMKFDYIIGNPPYQDESLGDNKNYAPPIYNLFLDEAYKIADKVEMIHPARFLFNAGSTPKDWNRKMLNDPHLKVLFYEQNSGRIFPGTDIKGGIAITYHDLKKNFGAVKHFIVFNELRSILEKVDKLPHESLSSIVYPSESYRFTEQMHIDFPDAESRLSKGHKYDLKTSVLETLSDGIFLSEHPASGSYVQIMGLIKGKRAVRWIKSEYLRAPDNFDAYKVFVPKSNGSGALGEVLATPLIGQPLIGHTQTYISIGCFQTLREAENLLKYIKSKFCRVMLGILKITQDNPAPKWKYVPLQNFTSSSDIDWSQSIPEIDRQLYKKYKLSKQEIDFIETHVKEMA